MWWWKKAKSSERQVLRCSFCGKHQQDVKRLIAGPRVFICDECVAVCNDIIREDERFDPGGGRRAEPREAEPLSWPDPISCALCGAPVSNEEGVAIGGNRGTLCPACAEVVDTTPRRVH